MGKECIWNIGDERVAQNKLRLLKEIRENKKKEKTLEKKEQQKERK